MREFNPSIEVMPKQTAIEILVAKTKLLDDDSVTPKPNTAAVVDATAPEVTTEQDVVIPQDAAATV